MRALEAQEGKAQAAWSRGAESCVNRSRFFSGFATSGDESLGQGRTGTLYSVSGSGWNTLHPRHWISVPVWQRAAEVPSPRCSACLQPALLGRGVWFQAGGGGVSDLLCEKRWGDFLVISDQL